MESPNYTEPFFGTPCLGKEDQTYLSLFGWEPQKCWSKCSGSGSLLPLQNDSHMLSIAMFRDTPHQSLPICFRLAASILCSHLDGGSLSLPYPSAKDANFFHPLLASHTSRSLSHRQLQCRNTSSDAPRSACFPPALLETHLPEALPKAAASEDAAGGGMGHPTAPLPFGTASNEALVSDTLTEHHTCSIGTLLSTLKHLQIAHSFGLAQHFLYSLHPLTPASPLF